MAAWRQRNKLWPVITLDTPLAVKYWADSDTLLLSSSCRATGSAAQGLSPAKKPSGREISGDLRDCRLESAGRDRRHPLVGVQPIALPDKVTQLGRV
jgi:hypothetical protein